MVTRPHLALVTEPEATDIAARRPVVPGAEGRHLDTEARRAAVARRRSMSHHPASGGAARVLEPVPG
jgi:hypothetical protein